MTNTLLETSSRAKSCLYYYEFEKSKLVSVITTTIAVIVFAFSFALSTINGAGIDIGIFNHSIGNLSRKYRLPITPIASTFMIWQFIYLWLAVMYIYAVVCLCRTGMTGRSVSSLALIFLSLANLSGCVWLFVWDWECLWGSFVALFMYFVFMWSSELAALVHFNKTQMELSKVDFWLTTILVNNCIAFNATWVALAAFLNLSTALTYGSDVPITCASIVGLVFWTIELLAYFGLDMFFLFKKKVNVTEFLFTPYIVFVWGLQGAFRQKMNLSEGVISVYLLALLIIATVFCIMKVSTTVFLVRERNSKKTLF